MSYRSGSDQLSCCRTSAHAVLQTAPLTTWILLHKVWVEGFEPPASCSQSTRATRLRYTQLAVLIDCGEDADNENGDDYKE